jgi:hypothetical protein
MSHKAGPATAIINFIN